MSSVLVALPLLRKRAFADDLREVLAHHPLLIPAGGGIDPVRDFDHVLVMAADPRAVTRTLIIIHHGLGEALPRLLDAAFDEDGETIEWLERDGRITGDPRPRQGRDFDPRIVVIMDESHVAYVRPEFVPLIAPALARMRAFERSGRQTVLLVDARIDDPRRSDHIPKRLELAFDASSEDFSARGKLTFPSPDVARSFVEFWNGDLQTQMKGSRAPWARSLHGRTVVKRTRAMVELPVSIEPWEAASFVRMWAEYQRPPRTPSRPEGPRR